jgi:hypothetical protein
MNAEFNERIFDAMLEMACHDVARSRVAALPEEHELGHEFSADFELRMRKLIRKSSRPARYERNIKFLTRIVAIFLVIMSAGFTVAVSNAGVREIMLNAVVEFGNDHLGISFGNTGDVSGDAARPTYLPEGFVETSVDDTDSDITIVYNDAEGSYILYTAMIKAAGSGANFYFEDCEITNVDQFTLIDGSAAGKGSAVFWEDDVYFYSMVSELPIEVLLKVAMSSYEK